MESLKEPPGAAVMGASGSWKEVTVGAAVCGALLDAERTPPVRRLARSEARLLADMANVDDGGQMED